MKKVLTIAGSDCSGGAGIQADLKTITAHGMYGMSVITALTAQNTMGITGIHKVPGEFIEKQLETVFEDIFPDAVKIGMLPDPEAVEAVAKTLRKYNAKNIVLDTVLSSTSGTLLSDVKGDFMKDRLFNISTIITPNVPEAQKITGMKIETKKEVEEAAGLLAGRYECNVLIKGGHLCTEDKSEDCLCIKTEDPIWFEAEKINNPNTHGTGCTLSSAIACNLALGKDVPEAVLNAKEYITACIRDGLDIGRGRGPLNHMVRL